MEPAILVVDDEPASVKLLRLTLEAEFPVIAAESGREALARLAEHPEIALAIIDQRMPGMTGAQLMQETVRSRPDLIRIVLTAYTDYDALVEAINEGRVHRYLQKPWKKGELLSVVRQGLEVHRLAADNRRLSEELREANERLRRENVELRRVARRQHRFAGIVGSSPALRRVLDLVESAIHSDVTVLVLGETGTGKELVARAIHYNGARAERAFVSENCAAMTPDLLSSELFGHRRGAFTGAVEDRPGLFELADGGTLFLDEIGDCTAELQTRLLRVLDQGEVRRVGESRPIPVDVRLIAATHHDLRADVKDGRFREDLFYRLNVFTVLLPPLRERTGDVPLLAQHFLQGLIEKTGKRVDGFEDLALAILDAYSFPGNVRELENEVQRAFTLAREGAAITVDLLSPWIRDCEGTEPPAPPTGLRGAVEALEVRLIREALERHGGNQTHAAAELDLPRRTLIDKMVRYGIGRARAS